jgi:predicted nucleotidyltransferase
VFHQDFEDLLELLNEKGAKYLIVGGYAVGLHGEPRGTKDLDIWIGTDVANAQKVINALNDFSSGSIGMTAKKLASPGSMMTFGVAPLRVDILAQIAGSDFDQCYKRRVKAKAGKIKLSLISLKDLITNKSAAGRKQDLADVEKLKKLAAKLANKK